MTYQNTQLRYTDYVAHYKADAEFGDYFTYNPFYEQAVRRRYETFFSLYRIRKDDRVLEVGSGGGQALKYFKHHDFHYFPLDIPHKNLLEIKRRANFFIKPAAGDAFHLPFRAESFDVIIISEILEHLDNVAAALQEAGRVLKPSGCLLISTPYKEKITYHLCIHCNRPTPGNAHLHSFDEKKLMDLVGSVGLKTEKKSLANNKIADRLSFNLLMKYAPFKLWKMFDRLFNLVVPKAAYLILVAKKHN